MTESELQENITKWRSDFQSYAETNLHIIDKDSNLIPFKFNRMQKRVWQLLLYCLLQGKPIRILCIKDRQIGFTTFISGFFYWLTTLFPNRNSLIVSHDIDSAAGIFGKIKLFFKMSIPELRPLRKISNRREMYFANPDEAGELGLESRIVIDTADTEELGVSYTLQLVLLSELAIWESMGLNIKKRLVALNQAIPDRAGTAIIIETTPRGEGYVSNMWADESNGFIKIFISSVADEQYRVELDPANYFELADFEEHRYGNEVEEFFDYEQEVKQWYPEFDQNTEEGKQRIHHEVMCRLAWRRETIDKKCEGDKEIFDREYPITIEKAFSSSGSKIFQQDIINKQKQLLRKATNIVTRFKYERELDDFGEYAGGHLKIFEDVLPGFKYVIGGDVGQGSKDGDHSALSCRRLPELNHVFTFNDTIDPKDFAKITCNLAKHYNNAFVGMEVNEKGGYAAVEYLINVHNYRNLYFRESMLAEIDMNGPKKVIKYGWITGKNTKPVMISDYREWLRNGLEIKDLELLDQLGKYQTIIISTKYGEVKTLTGVLNGKDDLAIADMICLQMPQHVLLSIPESKPKYKWTLNWWATKIKDYQPERIGGYSRGPDGNY